MALKSANDVAKPSPPTAHPDVSHGAGSQSPASVISLPPADDDSGDSDYDDQENIPPAGFMLGDDAAHEPPVRVLPCSS